MKLRVLTINNWHLILAAMLALTILFSPLAFGDADSDDETGDETEAAAEEEEQEAEYVGTMNCLMCHADYKEGFLMTRHALSLGNPKAMPAEQGCEQCHGAGSLHMEKLGNDPGERGIFAFIEEKADEQYLATCLHCHETRIDGDDWMESCHRKSELTCSSCHRPHERQFEFQLIEETSSELCYNCHTSTKIEFETRRSHHPMDPAGCTACHDPHGEPDWLLDTEALEDLCGRCHADTAGPFIYQHLTGTSDVGDGCMSCHFPHSSGNLNLLKANGRALCLSCHTEMADHKGAATCWTSGCHSQVHGSNDNLLFIR